MVCCMASMGQSRTLTLFPLHSPIGKSHQHCANDAQLCIGLMSTMSNIVIINDHLQSVFIFVSHSVSMACQNPDMSEIWIHSFWHTSTTVYFSYKTIQQNFWDQDQTSKAIVRNLIPLPIQLSSYFASLKQNLCFLLDYMRVFPCLRFDYRFITEVLSLTFFYWVIEHRHLQICVLILRNHFKQIINQYKIQLYSKLWVEEIICFPTL